MNAEWSKFQAIAVGATAGPRNAGYVRSRTPSPARESGDPRDPSCRLRTGHTRAYSPHTADGAGTFVKHEEDERLPHTMERLLPILVGLTIALSPFSSGVARDTAPSGSEEQQSALCSAALRTAEQKYGTPPGLLDAIAKAESGRRVTGVTTLQPWP